MSQLLHTKDSMSQQERLIPALLPESFPVDDRDMADLLSYLHEVAGQINYYNTEDEIAGDWTSFLESDPAVLTAVLSKLDISELEKSYDRVKAFLQETGFAPGADILFTELFTRFTRWEKRVGVFRDHFNSISGRSGVTEELNTVLGAYMQLLWAILSHNPASPGQVGTAPDIKSSWTVIDPLFSALKTKHAYLLTLSGEYLQAHELLEQSYSPHMGMLISFLDLYGHLQNDLNDLTGKHLDLYYREILGFSQLPAVADQVSVFFEPDVQLKTILRLEAGTELQAVLPGTEKTFTYRMTGDVQLSPARIVDLKTVCISDRPILGEQAGAADLREARIYQGSYSRPEPGDFLKEGGRSAPSWPILGEDQSNLAEKDRTMTDAETGILFGSPLFYLPEGGRTIRLELVFTEASFRVFTDFIKNFSALAGKSLELVHIELLSDAFCIDYTAPAGWAPVLKYRLKPLTEMRILEVSFVLEYGASPMISYRKNIHRLPYTASTPLIRMLINNNSAHSAYSFFRELVLERVNIHVSVREFRSIRLQNNIGILSAANPFQIFGPQPVTGSFLDLKNTNVFNRYTTGFCLWLEWLALPRDGFTRYYEGYLMNSKNDSYRVRMGGIAGGRYDMQPEHAQDLDLFDTGDGDSPLRDRTRLDGGDIRKFSFDNVPLLEKESGAQDTIFIEGAIRVELISPSEAFGHLRYPDILRHYARGRARKKSLPNPPFTPVVKSVTLDYSLGYSELLSGGGTAGQESGETLRIIHQFPFGYKELFPDNDEYNYHFLPQFGGRNHLYIGLRDLIPNQELSLLFQLEETRFHHSAHSPASVTWSYLRENRWRAIDAGRILSDSTGNFIHSGILRIIVPPAIQRGNSIMDPDLYWLRASASVQKSSLARVIAVFTHGAAAVRVMEKRERGDQAFRLPPGSIKDLKRRIPLVRNVWQLFVSTDGQPAETDMGYRIRVSERLRHKDRPLSTRDIEQFILKEFPGIYLAKCFGIGKSGRLILPGVNVQVIVIPKEQEDGRFSTDQPHVNLAMLYQIKDYLCRVVTPYVHVEVGNPVYEKVKIACHVMFRDTLSSDYGLLLARLHEDIRRYLCPWLFEGGAGIIIGGRIYVADILNYLKNLPYISYVTSFSAAHFFRVQDIDTGEYKAVLIDSARQGVVCISGSIPGAVLIPAERHLIKVLDSRGYASPDPMGIGSLSVGDELLTSETTAGENGDRGNREEEHTDPGDGEDLFTLIIHHPQ